MFPSNSRPPPLSYFLISFKKVKHSPLMLCLMLCLQVRWMQQQHEKVRRKRDVSFGYSGAGQYGIIRPPIDFRGSLNSPRLTFGPPGGSFHSAIPRAPRIQYRDTAHSIFPDPLFKEQWYLVSKVCIGWHVE